MGSDRPHLDPEPERLRKAAADLRLMYGADTGASVRLDRAAARIAELEAALSAEKAKVAEAVRERDNSRANSVSRGKKLLRLRTKLIEISDNIEHEGDRAYFGSTNDADSLREIFNWLDGFKWDRAMSESDEYDLLSSVERLLARAEAAEAEAARLREALHAVQDATAAYLPPDGIGAQECLNRILQATDNPTINAITLGAQYGRP